MADGVRTRVAFSYRARGVCAVTAVRLPRAKGATISIRTSATMSPRADAMRRSMIC